MQATTPLYRAAKRAVNALPPWVLRFRPFVVYEIPLASGARKDHDLASASKPVIADIRWIRNCEDANSLLPLASRACVDQFNGTTRRAAVASLDGQRVGCAWIATGSFSETDLELHFELAPDEAWLYAAAVAPAHRNRGVYRQLLEFLIADLRAAGVRRLLLGITVGNEPSRRAHARLGAIEVGRILALRALGLTRCWCSGGVRNQRGELGERRTARLSIAP
jgi:ribosomal protein S18 acetylase RimI-like enzyme